MGSCLLNTAENGEEPMPAERILRTVDAGSHPVYVFLEHDEFNIKLAMADDRQRFVLLDKTALSALASTLYELARDFAM
jgi:hypothetical protein